MVEHKKKDPRIAEEVIRIRLSQLKLNEHYKLRQFKVPIHLAMGHESIAVAISEAMGPHDTLIAAHRNLHLNLAREKNNAYRKVLHEFLLMNDGLAHGKLGSMNLANFKNGPHYSSSILGNNVPVATGAALANKLLKKNDVVFLMSGDGAIEEGSFHEGILFMSSHNLASVIIVENNQWSLATKIDERRCEIDLGAFCNSMAVEYHRLSSNDVYEYTQKISELRKEASAKSRPIVVEIDVHTLGDWRIKTDEHSEGRYINYHWGVAKNLSLDSGPVIIESKDDPVFVLLDHFSNSELKDFSSKCLSQLFKEEAQ